MNVQHLNLQKQIARLEVAYDIVSDAHSDICHSSSRSDEVNIAELSLDAAHDLIRLIAALKNIEKGQNQSLIDEFAERGKGSDSHGLLNNISRRTNDE